MAIEIGKANHSGSGSKTRFKLKDGDNIFRILPPLGKAAKLKKYSQYYSVVWGYENSAGKLVPFQDCRRKNFKTKMIEVESSAYLRSMELKNKLEDARKMLKEGKVTEAQFDKIKTLSEKFNIENKHFLNAMDLQGNIGLLKVGMKAMEQIRNEFKKLEAKGVDGVGVDSGRFLNIEKSGTGFGTTYKVTIYEETINVPGVGNVKKEKVHVLTEDIIERLEFEAFDLLNLYPAPSSEEVDRIVKEGPRAVDEIFGVSESLEVEETEDSPESEQPIGDSGSSIKKEATLMTNTETPTASGVLSDDELENFMKSII